jgi:acetamidase/formamidase
LPATPYLLSAAPVVYALDARIAPRLTLTAPAEAVIETLDARAGRLRRPEDAEGTAPDYRDRFPKANPATGPIAIEGAEPGDVITAEILKSISTSRLHPGQTGFGSSRDGRTPDARSSTGCSISVTSACRSGR